MGDIKVSGLKSQERGKRTFYYGDKKVPSVFAGSIPAYSEFTFTIVNATYPYLNGQWNIGDISLWYDDSMVIQAGPTPSGINATYWKRDNLPYYILYDVNKDEWEIFSGITPQEGLSISTGDIIDEDFNIIPSPINHNNNYYPYCGLNPGATSGFNITIEYQNAPLICIPISPSPTPSNTPTPTPTQTPGASPQPTPTNTPTTSFTPTPTPTNVALPPSTFEFSSTFGGTADQFVGTYNYVGIGYYDLNDAGTDTIFYSGATPTGELYAYWEKDGAPTRTFHWMDNPIGPYPLWRFLNTTTGNGYLGNTTWDASNTIETASGIKYLSGGTYETDTFVYP